MSDFSHRTPRVNKVQAGDIELQNERRSVSRASKHHDYRNARFIPSSRDDYWSDDTKGSLLLFVGLGIGFAILIVGALFGLLSLLAAL